MIEEEIRCNDGKGNCRRKGVSIIDRRLLRVIATVLFENERDFLRFLPASLGELFINKMLARESGISISLARKITYCLRAMGMIRRTGRKGKEFQFQQFKSDSILC